MSNGEAGWKPDPTNPAQFRFWNGTGWTDEVFVPPAAPAPQPVPVVPGETQAPLPSLPSPPVLMAPDTQPSRGRTLGITAMWLGIALYPIYLIGIAFVRSPIFGVFIILIGLAAFVVGILALRQLSPGEVGRGPAIAGVVLAIPLFLLVAVAVVVALV